MKHLVLTTLSIGLLAMACDSTPKMSGNGGGSGMNPPPDSGVSMMNPDSGVTGNPDAMSQGTPDSGVAMMDPDSGVDFTRDPNCPMSAAWITTVSGKVTDEMGNPIEKAWAQLCLVTNDGTAVCLTPADTIADGTFEVLVPVENRCLVEMTMRNLVLDEDRATMYCHLDVQNAESAYEVQESLKLYPTQAATMLPPEGDKEMARDVEFPSGLVLNLAPQHFYGEYEKLAAAPVDPAGLCFIKDASKVDGLYAFSPEGTAAVDFSNNTIREIGIKLPVPSNSMASPGDTYKLFGLGGLGCPDPTSMEPGSNFIKEGDWVQFGTGTVDMNGTMIEGDPGAGVPCLTWVKIEKD